MNNVLWMNAEVGPVANWSPLKNNKKGIEPPIRPINANFSQDFLVNDFSSLNCFRKNIVLRRKIATSMFFEKVKILESMPLTPNEFRNIAKPDMIAVAKTSFTPLFMGLK